jgi:hypothetical protein
MRRRLRALLLSSSTDRSFREQKELKRFNTFQAVSLRMERAKHNGSTR